MREEIPAQHKRPGSTAKAERQIRADLRKINTIQTSPDALAKILKRVGADKRQS